MSNYNYAPGAIHIDHHNDLSIDVKNVDDAIRLMSAFMSNRKAEDITPSEASSFTSDCQSDSRTQRGRKTQRLFVDAVTAEQEKDRLLNFLHLHNLGSREFDSSEDSSVNQIAVCFYRQWAKRNLLDEKAGTTAYVRFLKYDCHLPISVLEKALGNVLSRMLNSEHTYSTWSGEISEYFQM